MVGPEIRRSVEKLAQTLYEASDPDGPPWVNRGRVVREPWLDLARERIRQSEDHDRTDPSTKVEP